MVSVHHLKPTFVARKGTEPAQPVPHGRQKGSSNIQPLSKTAQSLMHQIECISIYDLILIRLID